MSARSARNAASWAIRAGSSVSCGHELLHALGDLLLRAPEGLPRRARESRPTVCFMRDSARPGRRAGSRPPAAARRRARRVRCRARRSTASRPPSSRAAAVARRLEDARDATSRAGRSQSPSTPYSSRSVRIARKRAPRRRGRLSARPGFGAFRPCPGLRSRSTRPRLTDAPAPCGGAPARAAPARRTGAASGRRNRLLTLRSSTVTFDPRSFGSALAVPCHGADHGRPGLEHPSGASNRRVRPRPRRPSAARSKSAVAVKPVTDAAKPRRASDVGSRPDRRGQVASWSAIAAACTLLNQLGHDPCSRDEVRQRDVIDARPSALAMRYDSDLHAVERRRRASPASAASSVAVPEADGACIAPRRGCAG